MPKQPNPEETRAVSGGIDTDSAPEKVQPGDVLNAVNIRALQQKGQQGGRREWIPGNTEVNAVTSVLPVGTNTLLGKCVDEGTGKLYLFLHNGSNSVIIEYTPATGSCRVCFDDTLVTGGLGWTSTMFIDCEAGDGYLYFADGVHDLRYIVTGTTYSVTITQAQLSLGQEPGVGPPYQSRTSPSGSSTIQYTPLQFASRIINTDGHTSVLSPYSDTAQPARQSDVAISANAGKGVTITLPVQQKIPANWKRVELIVRFLESNVYYVIKRWDVSVNSDVTAINNHNSGSSALSLASWTGSTIETLDEISAEKPFDLIPRAPKRLRLAANRLLSGNFIEGYDTPANVPAITISTSTYSPAVPTTSSYQTYMLAVEEKNTRNWWFAIIVRFGGKNYLFPKECSVGKFYFDNNTIPDPTSTSVDIITDGIFQLPYSISSESLIELKESGDPDLTTIARPIGGPADQIRANVVAEANGLSTIAWETSGGPSMYSFKWTLIPAIEDALTSGNEKPGGKTRAFVSGTYNRGLQYYDGLGRKSGVINLGTTTIPDYNAASPSFTEIINSTTPTTVSAGVIPDWAESFGLTLSRASNALRFGFFFGGIIKALFKTGDGLIVYGDKAELTSVPAGKTIYGIGIPIPNSFKYVYLPGDYILFSVPGGATSSGRATIIDTHGGMIVVQYTAGMEDLATGFSKKLHINYNTGTPIAEMSLSTASSGQFKTAITVMSGVSNATDLFEVAAFGSITGSAGNKQFGAFFKTTTHSIDIFGDAHTQKRTSNGGGGTGISMSPYEVNGQQLIWMNDLGRPTPTDSVGQKTLSSSIRWSNTRIPGATINGYGSFDGNDIATTDITAGEITVLMLTTRGAQDGGQLLVLCKHGSFSALVGQQQIAGADGNNAFTAAAGVLGGFNALRGQFGCQSPRGATEFEGHCWWPDAYKRGWIEFGENGAGNIARFRMSRAWDKLLSAVTNPLQISAAVDPFTGCLVVSLPTVSVTPANMPGFESTVDSSDAVNGAIGTWMYDWNANRWVNGYTSGAEMVRCGSEVYGWKGGKLWHEFNGTAGTYYGVAQQAILAIPFNEGSPVVKAPVTLKLTCGNAPNITRILAGGGSATVAPVSSVEGVTTSAVMGNRVGNGATTNAAFAANGANGYKLKSDVIVSVLYWSGGTPIDLSNATLTYEVSSGH